MMVKKILLLAIATVMIMSVGCVSKGKEEVTEKVGTESKVKGEEFKIEYAYWYNPDSKNIFSTYDNYIQKDLISAGKAKEEWNISYGDLKRIEELIRKYEVCKIDKNINALDFSKDDNNYITIPMEEFYIKFTIDGNEYLLEGNWTIYDIKTENEEAKEICEFLDTLKGIMRGQDVFTNMPQPEGAYE